MKVSTIFWGTFLICLGILFLLEQMDLFNGSLSFIFKLWPLLIIIWGVSLLKIPDIYKKIMASFSAILLAMFIVASVSHGYHSIKFYFSDDNCCTNNSSWKKEQIITQSLNYTDSLSATTLNIDAAAGKFMLSDTSAQLIDVTANGVWGDISLSNDTDWKNIYLNFDSNLNFDLSKDKQFNREMKIALSPKVEWSFDIDAGASSFFSDLSSFKVKSIDIEAGAAKIDFKIGERSDTVNINVECGASSVDIDIPSSFACELFSKTSLSGRSYHGFIKDAKGYWRTENYGKTNKIIFLNISGGVSSFKVNRYSEKEI